MTRFQLLVPALLFATPVLAQTDQPPPVTQMQQVNNGIASTAQFLGAMKGLIEQQSAYIDAYKAELTKVTKERDDAVKERDALKASASKTEPEKH